MAETSLRSDTVAGIVTHTESRLRAFVCFAFLMFEVVCVGGGLISNQKLVQIL